MNQFAETRSVQISACRSCGSGAIVPVLDLGLQPIANALLGSDDLEREEAVFPLKLLVCEDCNLAQISETIPPDVLFGDDYPYFSSFIPALLAHSREHALALIDERRVGAEDLVIEIASNDGYLLKNFVEAGIPAFGIDPAAGPVAAARAAGVETVHAFFDCALAKQMSAQGKRASVMLANNVLAHVEDINAFVAGFAEMLRDDGIAEFEFPYVRELVERCAFDTIYHEHVFYFSLAALEPLFNRHGLHLNDATPIEIHGGSLRLRVSKAPGKSDRLRRLEDEERFIGLDRADYYRNFAGRVSKIRGELVHMLDGYRSEGKRIAAYGAAAKGATLLNFANLGAGTIDYVVDRNTHKVGKYMPGVRLPIRDVAALSEIPPDVLLILPWNFCDEIIEQQRDFAAGGGVFVRAVPSPEVIRP